MAGHNTGPVGTPWERPRLIAQRTVELATIKGVLEQILEKASLEARKPTLVEIGGGSGFLAAKLHEMGFEVHSFDPSPREPLWHPVTVGLGHELPFPSHSVDVVFSSQVLEHIPEPFLGLTLEESRRVLRSDGKMIFLVPSSACAFLTILLQPIARLRQVLRLPGRALRRIRGNRKPMRNNNPLCPRRENLLLTILKAVTLRWFLPPPHGACHTALHELLNWRISCWKKILEAHGFDLENVNPSGLAGSLHQLSGNQWWGRALRQMLGSLGMSATHAFVATPRG